MQAKTSFDKNHSTSKTFCYWHASSSRGFFLRMEDLKFKGTYAHYIIKVGLYHYYIILPEKNADLSLSVHSSEDNAVKLLR